MLSTVNRNFSIDKTFVGLGVSKAFSRILYGDDSYLPQEMDASIAIFASRTKASDLYYQCKFMVNYLEASGGKEPVQHFLQAINQDSKASKHYWKISRTKEVYLLNNGVSPSSSPHLFC